MKKLHKKSEYLKGFEAGIRYQKSKGVTLNGFVTGTALGIWEDYRLNNFSEDSQCPVTVQVIKKNKNPEGYGN